MTSRSKQEALGRVRPLDSTEAVPDPALERVAVHVTSDALRQVRSGHPWVWDRSITRTSKPGKAGDLAVIFDDKRRFAAIGLWDPHAPIAVRVLHSGNPREISEDFFTERLVTAVDRRRQLEDDGDTTGYRLVHGENDGLPGLVIDRYDTTLVVKLDTAAWLPHLPLLLPQAVSLADAERVVLRASRRIAAELTAPLTDGATIIGEPPAGPIRFLENGLLFEADVERGQKTGHFLDQRDNRRLIGSQCADADVLDVFCNTGGFSVYAAAGGARSVHSIDISRYAVEATTRHIELNREILGFAATHTGHVADAFDAMAELAERHVLFDVVIVDPPSFAPNSISLPSARRAYRRLTTLAAQLISPGGRLLQASCSSRLEAPEFYALVNDGLADAQCRATKVVRTNHALDHPIGFAHGAYLKAVFAEVGPASSVR